MSIVTEQNINKFNEITTGGSGVEAKHPGLKSKWAENLGRAGERDYPSRGDAGWGGYNYAPHGVSDIISIWSDRNRDGPAGRPTRAVNSAQLFYGPTAFAQLAPAVDTSDASAAVYGSVLGSFAYMIGAGAPWGDLGSSHAAKRMKEGFTKSSAGKSLRNATTVPTGKLDKDKVPIEIPVASGGTFQGYQAATPYQISNWHDETSNRAKINVERSDGSTGADAATEISALEEIQGKLPINQTGIRRIDGMKTPG